MAMFPKIAAIIKRHIMRSPITRCPIMKSWNGHNYKKLGHFVKKMPIIIGNAM